MEDKNWDIWKWFNIYGLYKFSHFLSIQWNKFNKWIVNKEQRCICLMMGIGKRFALGMCKLCMQMVLLL